MIGRFNKTLGFILALMLALAITLTYRQAFSEAISAHPGNRRALLEEFYVERGSIFTIDGAPLAVSKKTGETFKRSYPKGAQSAAVTGYYDPVRGRTGIEAAQSEWLAAGKHFRSFNDWLNAAANKPRRGFDVTLTIRSDIQQRAWELLEGRQGAIVALDPKTGAVQALVSRPIFDPNLVADHWPEISSTEGLLVNRATQGLYPPGSTFKIITTAAALDAGTAKPSSIYNGPAVLPVYGGKVTNFADQDAGRMSLTKAFAKSTNTIFAQVGLDVGADRLTRTARGFGFNSEPPLDTFIAKSVIEDPGSMDRLMTAWTAVGQGETLATPLQMALTGSAIAAEGQIFRPYLTAVVRDYTGLVRFEAGPRPWLRAAKAGTAARIKAMMIESVRSGTSVAAAVEGVKVAGKTGTAEVGGSAQPHAWFVGFAPADDPKVVVVVLVENGGLGGRTAAPIAREIFKTALSPSGRH